VEQAIEQLLNSIDALSEIIYVPLKSCLGLVVAEDISSQMNVPAADNSAMDGYAVNVEDLKASDTLTLVGSSLAGAPYSSVLTQGQCVRITTGGVIPQGANGVMMQENVHLDGNQVRFLSIPSIGQSIRKAGESIQIGQVVVERGTVLSPAHIGLVASLGIATLPVVRKLKVAVLSTGDELKEIGDELKVGDVYDSNRPALVAALQQFGVEVIDLGIIADNKSMLLNAFNQANEVADAVVTSGGVSVGDADYTKEVLEDLGQIEFWKLAIKPGKPFAFGRLPDSLFFGLPGNPVSAMVTLNQLVLPALQKYRGAKGLQRLILSATASQSFKKRPGRTDYQRATFVTDESGELFVQPSGAQGSGIFSSITQANCFAILPQDSGDIETGQQVQIQPFDQFIR
jgi:molybdopterin molybdotransferase